MTVYPNFLPSVGDQVAVCFYPRLGGGLAAISTEVTKITATLIVVERHGARFRRSDMVEHSSGWDRSHLRQMDDPEVLDAYRRQAFRSAMEEIHGLSDRTMRIGSPPQPKTFHDQDNRLLEIVRIVGDARRKMAIYQDRLEGSYLSCGCLRTKVEAHRVGCPDYPEGMRPE